VNIRIPNSDNECKIYFNMKLFLFVALVPIKKLK
jgi:hypothetical protein